MQLLRRAANLLYAGHLRAALHATALPRHVAIVMDGNRRWARQMGFDDPRIGHRYGAEHVDQLLVWCREVGIQQVSVFVASIDNLRKRDSDEVDNLMQMIEEIVAERLSRPSNIWQVHLAGQLDALPDSTRNALKVAEEATRDRDEGFHLTVAIGYDGREEIVNAVRSLLQKEARAGVRLHDLTTRMSADTIAEHLYTRGLPDPDLVIRTSGEQRLSGFLLWQSAHSQLYFCDVYWPGFRKIDFLRALRSYAARRRRSGEQTNRQATSDIGAITTG